MLIVLKLEVRCVTNTLTKYSSRPSVYKEINFGVKFVDIKGSNDLHKKISQILFGSLAFC